MVKDEFCLEHVCWGAYELLSKECLLIGFLYRCEGQEGDLGGKSWKQCTGGERLQLWLSCATFFWTLCIWGWLSLTLLETPKAATSGSFLQVLPTFSLPDFCSSNFGPWISCVGNTWELLEMQDFRPHPRPTHNMHFNKIPRWSAYTLEFNTLF